MNEIKIEGRWVSCSERQPARSGKYSVIRRTRGRKTVTDTYLWNGAYWVTNGNSPSKAVEQWWEEVPHDHAQE